MPRICYTPKRFTEEQEHLILRMNQVITAYVKQGYDITLRQLYYQFIARDWLPVTWIDEQYNLKKGLPIDTKNTEKNYKRLGALLNDARLAGRVDWEAVVDRTRNIRSVSHWETAQDILNSAAKSWAIDKWADQDHRVEVWIEKDALLGVIEPICQELDVSYFSCRGYTSSSELWSAAQRLDRYVNEGQMPVIIHLGDHDPSGVDMTRDIGDRINLFMRRGSVEVERIALTMAQVNQYNAPPNPAKLTDSRCKSYILEYGEDSWELDALEPTVLGDLITNAVLSYRDEDRWDAKFEHQEDVRAQLNAVADQWDSIRENL